MQVLNNVPVTYYYYSVKHDGRSLKSTSYLIFLFNNPLARVRFYSYIYIFSILVFNNIERSLGDEHAKVCQSTVLNLTNLTTLFCTSSYNKVVLCLI